tara:strand:+ start:2032 stop:2757 length:726 start_codon:yes stop_codon:yes gene_type:complete
MGSFLIVGGSSDIGQILCKALVAKGHAVCATGRDSSRMKVLEEIGVTTLIGDATDEEFIDGAVSSFMTIDSGKLDGVAHLVGSIAIRPPHAMKVADFEQVLSTNLTSAFLVLSKSCKYMLRNGGGRLVFTSSVAAGVGLTNHEAISAAKGGVESMARSAAATYSKRGIRVNTVAPGLTDTRLASPITKTESSKEAAVSKIPLNRINEPYEIAEAIQWLLTEAPDNLTGQVLNLDGGMSSLR